MTRAVVKSVCEPEPPGRIKWIEKKKKKKRNCPLNCVKAKSSKRSLQTTHYLKGYALWLSKLHLSVSFLPFYESPSLPFVVVHFCSSDTTTTKNILNCGIFFKGWFRGRNPRWMKIKQEVRNIFFFWFPNADTSLCFLVVLAVLAAGVDPDGRPSGLLLSPLLFPPFIPSFTCCFSVSLFSAGGRLAQVLQNNLP